MELTLTRPDDWHLHVRDGAALASILPHSARQFGRAIIMPNLQPPVATTAQALAYRKRILAAVPPGADFRPLMTLYLTDNTLPDDIIEAHASEQVCAVKLYPAGATTHSDSGVSAISKTYAALEVMEHLGVPLLVHAEVTDPEIDVFDREQAFIDQHLEPLTVRYPALKVVLEHVTTHAGIEFVSYAPDNVAATITAHHLLLNRNAMFRGGLQPHAYCLPVLKRERHRTALVEAAIGGSGKFFLGTDSAPHAKERKETACGCAGIYTAHAAMELYAQVFEDAGALDKLEGFASHFGADFYGLPRNTTRITLEKHDWQVPENYPLGDSVVVPLFAGETLHWRMKEQT
ncbi:MAG: dihydroorotase [Gammaproteobacteria bacterium]|jgi:dihydroorotase|nr:dihydroorotase [Gammaproteobacteria bacterium]